MMEMGVSRCIRTLFSCLLFVACAVAASGQDMKVVSGRIVNKTTNMPFGNEVAVFIYKFNTVAEAEDAFPQIKDGGTFFANDYETADNNGYYQIRVPETGALIFKAEMADEPVLEKVNYRMEINVALVGGNILKSAVKSATLTTIAPIPENPEIEGNNLRVKAIIPIPKDNGKANARMILQPFLMDGQTNDTIKCLTPYVIDGKEYAMTQDRRMGFDHNADPLKPYVRDIELTSDRMNVMWTDTIELKDPNKSYFVRGVVRFEDYNVIYFEKDYELASARVRRPLKFLEYSVTNRDLDPNDYVERAQKERRNTADRISLTFKIGKAELDEADTMNRYYLDRLKSDLLDIVHGEDTQLKEFHILGISSPDGTYAKNLQLAKERMRFALNQITSVLPRRVRDRVYMTTKAEVAPWKDVADLMMEDSLVTEAEAIYRIIDKFPGNHDRQGKQIRALKFYRPTVVDYLPKLRSIQYSYVQEINRELTPAEILERYETDQDYRSGRKAFALYEYWHLFQMVKDKDELFELYRRAYEDSKKVYPKGWVLAANNLASACIERGIVDTTILAPFIDTRVHSVNKRIMHMNGITSEIVNPEAVVANQLCMFLKDNNFKRASIMAQLLPDTEKNRELKAFTMCLGGYYKGGRTQEEREEAKKTFDIVKESTPRNKVVMYLAMNSAGGNALAERSMADLPQDDALTYYLWSVIYSRKFEADPNDIMSLMTAGDFLTQCFFKDEKYIGIAAGDADINKDIYKDAESRYKSGSLY